MDDVTNPAGSGWPALSTPPPQVPPPPRVLLVHLPIAVALAVAILHHIAYEWSWRWLFDEGWGLIELAHFVIPLTSAVLAAVAWRRLPAGSDRRLSVLLIALAAGSFYIAGEEHSWGQHVFGWNTPDGWAEINRQAETNLHNATSWLNEKPRVVLNVLVVLAVIVVPAMQATGRGTHLLERVRFVLPSRDSRPIGLMIVFYMIWDPLAKAQVLPKIAPREAEMHELFLYAFILLYALTLLRRITEWRRMRGAAPRGGRSVA